MKLLLVSLIWCKILIFACLSTHADTLPSSLEGKIGDLERGKALYENHRVSLCLLCHKEGSLAPSLEGVGARLNAAQLRFRITDMRKINEKTLMPPFYSTTGLVNVHERFKDKTLLTAQEIEDLIAFLVTLNHNPF